MLEFVSLDSSLECECEPVPEIPLLENLVLKRSNLECRLVERPALEDLILKKLDLSEVREPVPEIPVLEGPVLERSILECRLVERPEVKEVMLEKLDLVPLDLEPFDLEHLLVVADLDLELSMEVSSVLVTAVIVCGIVVFAVVSDVGEASLLLSVGLGLVVLIGPTAVLVLLLVVCCGVKDCVVALSVGMFVEVTVRMVSPVDVLSDEVENVEVLAVDTEAGPLAVLSSVVAPPLTSSVVALVVTSSVVAPPVPPSVVALQV